MSRNFQGNFARRRPAAAGVAADPLAAYRSAPATGHAARPLPNAAPPSLPWPRPGRFVSLLTARNAMLATPAKSLRIQLEDAGLVSEDVEFGCRAYDDLVGPLVQAGDLTTVSSATILAINQQLKAADPEASGDSGHVFSYAELIKKLILLRCCLAGVANVSLGARDLGDLEDAGNPLVVFANHIGKGTDALYCSPTLQHIAQFIHMDVFNNKPIDMSVLSNLVSRIEPWLKEATSNPADFVEITEATYIMSSLKLTDRLQQRNVHFEYTQLPLLQLYDRFVQTDDVPAGVQLAVDSMLLPERQLLAALPSKLHIKTLAPLLDVLGRNHVWSIGNSFLRSLVLAMKKIVLWQRAHPGEPLPPLVIFWDGDNVFPSAGTHNKLSGRKWIDLHVHGLPEHESKWRYHGRMPCKYHAAVPGSEAADHAAAFHVNCNVDELHDRLIIFVSGDGSFQVIDGLTSAMFHDDGSATSNGASVMRQVMAHALGNEQPAAVSVNQQRGWIRRASSWAEVEVVLTWIEMILTGFDDKAKDTVNRRYDRWDGKTMGSYQMGSS